MDRPELAEITKLAQFAELRDEMTGRHIQRVGTYASVVARALGRGAADCSAILEAAKLHDIGKIAIPDSILKKRGPLSDGEWIVMRTHAPQGADRLAGSRAPLLQMAERIARHHHERWDGTGYPDGLMAETIPTEARIVAVCEAFDVMTSKQLYREPVTIDEAAREIEANAGSQFDPAVVTAFVSALSEIKEMRRRFDAGC